LLVEFEDVQPYWHIFRFLTQDNLIVNGNVGIGTTPAEDLHVDGSIKAESKATIGPDNTNLSWWGIVAGSENIADGQGSGVLAGRFNEVNSEYSVITGGTANKAEGDFSVVSGGYGNRALGEYSFVGGGGPAAPGFPDSNVAIGNYTVITGGMSNEAVGNYGAIGGGVGNHVTGEASVVSGGSSHYANGDYSSIGGGYNNNTYSGANHATVAGGEFNSAGGIYSLVGGGYNNDALGDYSLVGGGYWNRALGDYSVVVGGGGPTSADSNTATGSHSFVGAGYNNLASGPYSFVAGGAGNTAGGNCSFAAGSGCNATGITSIALGSNCNTSGLYSFALGENANANHNNTFVWSDGSSTSSERSGQFRVGADGGVRLDINGYYFDFRYQVSVPSRVLYCSNGAKLTAAGVWTNNSSRDLKENYLRGISSGRNDEIILNTFFAAIVLQINAGIDVNTFHSFVTRHSFPPFGVIVANVVIRLEFKLILSDIICALIRTIT